MEAEREIEIEIIEKPADDGSNNVDDDEDTNPQSNENGEDSNEQMNVNGDAEQCVPQIRVEDENEVDIVIDIGNGDDENNQDKEISHGKAEEDEDISNGKVEEDEEISNGKVEEDEEISNGRVEEEENIPKVVPENEEKQKMNGGDKVVVIVDTEADVDQIDANVKQNPQENKENEKEKEPNNNTPSVMSSIAKFGTMTPKKDAGMFRVVQTEKCAACQKTVYAMEKLEMNGNVYHKTCFKCSHCSARLTPKTFSMNEGVIYCLTHFKQLFARKGNYDEGFGRQQYKKKWGDDKSKDSTATA